MAYVWLYLYLPHVIHPEAYGDFPHYANEKVSDFFINLIPKVFDLTMIEQGLYRPRFLAFVWQYTDTNLMILLDRVYSSWGIKMPLTLAVIPLSIFVWKKIYMDLFHSDKYGVGALFGMSLLFLTSVQTATFLFLRSAKIIVPFIAVAIVHWGITGNREKKRKCTKIDVLHCLLKSAIAFVLCTFDEQIIAAFFFVLCISILFSIVDKEVKTTTLISGFGFFLYIIYEKWWGRKLFEYFTPIEIKKHIHNISMIVTDFSFDYIKKSIEIYFKLLSGNIFGMIGIAVVLSFIIYFGLKMKTREKILALAIFGFSIALTLVLLIGLPILYYYDDFILSIYFISPLMLFIYGTMFCISNGSSSEEKTWKPFLVSIFSVIMLFNISNYETNHLRHLGINGGSIQFRDELYDSKQFNEYYDSVIVTREQYDRYLEDK